MSFIPPRRTFLPAHIAGIRNAFTFAKRLATPEKKLLTYASLQSAYCEKTRRWTFRNHDYQKADQEMYFVRKE